MSIENPLKLHPFLMLRTPYFSYQDFSVDQTKVLLKARIFQTAIYLATPALYEVLKAADFDWESLTDKAKLSLHKYHNRMCYRSTPFALFATFGATEWQAHHAPLLFSAESDKLHLQFDHQINCALARHLKIESKTDILWKNPSLHRVGQQFRYIKTIRKTGVKFDFRLEAIDADVVLKSIIKKAEKIGIDKTVLVTEIVDMALCSKEEAIDYISFLLSEEILLSSLAPTLIGVPFLNHFPKYPSVEAGEANKPLDSALPAHPTLLEAQFKVQHFLPEEDLADLKTPYYANTERNFEGGLAVHHQDSIVKAIKVLQKLNPSSNPQNLTDFIQQFSKRYEQQKVPLLSALDPEIGLGYGQQEQFNTQNLLDDLPFSNSTAASSLIWDETKQLLLNKWLATAQTDKGTIIHLNTSDLDQLTVKNTAQIPPSLFVMFRLLDGHLYIENAGGTSATALAGRFTLFNEKIEKQCRDIALQEQVNNPEVIFADLIQHFAYQTDNINLRKSIYDYEIPINGISALPVQHQIPLSDLTLRLTGNDLILESTGLKRRVIPRLTTAFNAQLNELSVFRFLYDLQSQNLQSSLTLNMESAFPKLNFYPRVMFEDIILCLAKWKLEETDLRVLNQKDLQLKKMALGRLKEKLNLPDIVAITRHDHQLVFNLKKDDEVEFFVSCLQGLKNIWVVEFPFSSAKKKVVTDTEGKPFIGQFIAHLINGKTTYSSPDSRDYHKPITKRTFIPGDEWLYLKLYCSPNFSNKLLAKEIFTLINQLEQQNRNMTWFFIRYHDPDPHVRIRIKETGFESVDLPKIFATALDKLVKNGFIHYLQTDSYVRELERYQLYGMDHVEGLSCKSSQLILHFIKRQQKQAELFVDHHFALYSVSKMIDAFITEPALKLDFLEQMFASFYKEFSDDKSLNVALDKKFRVQKATITEVLQHRDYIQARGLRKPFAQLLCALKEQKTRNRDLTDGQKTSFLADLIHMHLNRLFPHDQRQQEMIIYHFLAKYQKSCLARNKA